MKTATKKVEKKFEENLSIKYLDLHLNKIKSALESGAENMSKSTQLKYAKSINILSEILQTHLTQMEIVGTKDSDEQFNRLSSLDNSWKLELISLITHL